MEAIQTKYRTHTCGQYGKFRLWQRKVVKLKAEGSGVNYTYRDNGGWYS